MSVMTVERPMGQDDRLRWYIDQVDALSAANGRSPLWWCSNLSTRNRFLVPLDDLLRECREGGIPLWRRWLRLGVWCKDTVATAWRMLRRVRAARRLFAEKIAPDGRIYLIKSFAYRASAAGDRFRDPFFGRLAEYLSGHLPEGVRVLTIVTNFDEDDERLAAVSRGEVAPLEYFLSAADVVCGCIRLLAGRIFGRLRLAGPVLLDGRDIGPGLVRAFRGRAGGMSLHQYLHRAVARTIAGRFRVEGAVMTFEGNGWERMLALGLKEGQPGVRVTGYQHSVVCPAGAGVFPGGFEAANGPLPDLVLTTGNIPAEIIRSYGAFPPERVKAACALRYEYLRGLGPAARRTADVGPFTVLVAPEGMAEAVDLVRYALGQAARCPDVRFRIRTHPLTPLRSYLDAIGCSLESYPNVAASGCAEVAEDITQCDALLYWGSTVALEGLMIGVPLIHYDRGDLLSYDPLFRFDAFKWTVGRETPLADVLREIRELDPAVWDRLSRDGRAYVERYFLPVTEDGLALFLPSRTGPDARQG
ncbi:MAG: hypothetical protein V3571_04315 [Pseudodesulfovibrio sp.]